MDKNTFLEKYCSGLNERQRAAVCAEDGAVLLLAVPGSGKTTVLTAHLAYLIGVCGYRADEILAVTYTVAATEEMRSRFLAVYGELTASCPEFRTLNGICQLIIDYYGATCSRRAPFQLTDDERLTGELLREIYTSLYGSAPDDSTVKDMRTCIAYIKNSLLTPEQIKSLHTGIAKLPEIYALYTKELQRRQLMDYDDQLKYAYTILNRMPNVREHFRRRFRILCVDEAQDASCVQHAIIRLLAAGSGQIFMVGDEDQSIYGFRAANPEALTEFPTAYAGAAVLTLKDNYRSTPEIISCANRFISANRSRYEKYAEAVRPGGMPVQRVNLASRASEFDFLTEIARTCTQETAVLMRNNDSAVPLIDRFEREGIPYNCRRFEESFFNSRIVNDVKDFYRFSCADADTELFMRLYYKTCCAIPKQLALEACELSRQIGAPVISCLLSFDALSPYAKGDLRDLKNQISFLRTEKASLALNRLRYGVGYNEYANRMQLDTGKFDILQMLAQHVGNMAELIDRLDELKGLIAAHCNCKDHLFTLSTIHSAKGLEFKRVYLIDAYDGVLPSVRLCKGSGEDDIRLYEEERRLFYVAITRAKDELYLISTDNKSSFLDEVIPVK